LILFGKRNLCVEKWGDCFQCFPGERSVWEV